eukprot:1913826-Alexandrium_andersonii.AAC.1
MIPVRERVHENEHQRLARTRDAPPCTVGITATTARLRTKRGEHQEQEEQRELEASACARSR